MARIRHDGFDGGGAMSWPGITGFTNGCQFPSVCASSYHTGSRTGLAIGARETWFSFRYKCDRFPTNGGNANVIFQMAGGVVNPSGCPYIVQRGTGAMEFYTGNTIDAGSTIALGNFTVVLHQWYAIECHVKQNTLGGINTNGNIQVWVDGVLLFDHSPSTADTGIGIHRADGSLQAPEIGAGGTTNLSAASNAQYTLDDMIFDSAQRTNANRILALFPTEFGTHTAWANQQFAMQRRNNNGSTATSSTSGARLSFLVPTLRSLGIDVPTEDVLWVRLGGSSATGATAKLFVIINGVETNATVDLAASAFGSRDEVGVALAVTLQPDDVVEVGYEKDASGTARTCGRLYASVEVPADVVAPDPDTDVAFDRITYTGTGSPQLVALPFEPDFLVVVPTTGNVAFHWWDRVAEQSSLATSALSGESDDCIVTPGGIWVDGYLATNAVVFDVFLLKDRSQRLHQSAAFGKLSTLDNFPVALDNPLFVPQWVFASSKHLTTSDAGLVIRSPGMAGDNSMPLNGSTGTAGDRIQAMSAGALEFGTTWSDDMWTQYTAFDFDTFQTAVLGETVTWTGDGTSPRVIPTANAASAVVCAMVTPTTSGASSQGRSFHIRTAGFTGANSKRVASTSTSTTTGITALGTGSFTVEADCNLSGMVYEAMVFYEGVDALVPVLIKSTTSTPYAEGDPAEAVDDGMEVDFTALLGGAWIQIVENYHAGHDRLRCTEVGDINSHWDPITGMLTLGGLDTAANYQLVLRSITFESTLPPISQQRRRVTFQVTTDELDVGGNEMPAEMPFTM